MITAEQDLMEGIVETDETYIGGKIANKHRKVREAHTKAMQEGQGESNKYGVMRFVNRNKEARLVMRGEKSFKNYIQENVSFKSVIITDAHKSYWGLRQDYVLHKSVNHSKNEFVKGIFHTNTVESFFSILKRTIYGTYHQISPKHMQRYCEEVCYRFNGRKLKEYERFDITMSSVNVG